MLTEVVLTATALNGILAGASLDQTIKQVPSRHRIGVKAYAVYVRGADLASGIAWYAILANAAVMFTLIAILLAWRARAQERLFLPLAVAGALSIAHSLATLRAAPTLFSTRSVPLDDESRLATLFDRFARWQAIRAALQVLTFALLLWASYAIASERAFDISYSAGARDAAGSFMGGTEIRVLTAHGGKLYAGNGYWEDRPGPEGIQGAQILVLDGPLAQWRVDHAFDERLPNGRPRNQAVSALSEVTFATDASGKPLSKPASFLIASTWDLTGSSRIFVRDDDTGSWSATTLVQDRPARDFLPQVRSFGFHRDAVTGTDYAFAGHGPRGIFSGSYDATAAGHIRWSQTPELDTAHIPLDAFPGLAGRLRIAGFAECSGRLYAAVGQQIYERIDGKDPRWRAIYTNPHPYHSETGLRGLTAVSGRDGCYLLAAVEGDHSRIVRIDPADGTETTDLDLGSFLDEAWHTHVSYVIAAYNDMTTLHDPRQGDLLLLGLEVFIPHRSTLPADHRAVDVGYGRLDAGGWYLVRHADRHYELRQIRLAARDGDRPLVATRSIRVSPFPDDATVYMGGYDANKAPVHDSGWIVRGALETIAGPPR